MKTSAQKSWRNDSAIFHEKVSKEGRAAKRYKKRFGIHQLGVINIMYHQRYGLGNCIYFWEAHLSTDFPAEFLLKMSVILSRAAIYKPNNDFNQKLFNRWI